MRTNLKELLLKLQNIQMDLAEIRSMNLFTLCVDSELNVINVVFYGHVSAENFKFLSTESEKYNQCEFIRLLNYLNAEDN